MNFITAKELSLTSFKTSLNIDFGIIYVSETPWWNQDKIQRKFYCLVLKITLLRILISKLLTNLAVTKIVLQTFFNEYDRLFKRVKHATLSCNYFFPVLRIYQTVTAFQIKLMFMGKFKLNIILYTFYRPSQKKFVTLWKHITLLPDFS